MKILQVISSTEFGGAEKLITELSIALRKRGHDVDVAVFKRGDTSLKKTLLNSEIHVIEFSNSPYHIKNLFKLFGLRNKYDIIHTHNYGPQLFGSICAKFSKRPFITTEHSPSNRRRAHKWYACIDRWMYRQYKKIVGISTASIENLKTYAHPLHTEIILIPNGINVKLFHQTTPDFSLKKHQDRFIIINVAGFRHEKDQDTLIRGMQWLPKDRFELWLVGEGSRKQELEQLSEKLNVKDNVIFWGSRSDVPTLLRTADVVCMCSHYEGLSLSSIEGMSVDKPFVADDVTGLRELTEGVGILFPYLNDKAFAQTILDLYNDKNYYTQTAKDCYQKALNFDISKTVDAHEELYNTILMKS